MTSLSEKFLSLRKKMEAAVAASGGNRSVKLIAVSKMNPVSAIEEALGLNHRCFGENRVQEAAQKFRPLKATYPDIELHLIGALQTNKVEAAVDLFDVIQTLDRPKLAATIARIFEKTPKRPRLYVEINVGEEEQKSGVLPCDLASFLAYCRGDCGLHIDGVMCIPPLGKEPRRYFERVRKMADEHHLMHVSMGMSNDFEEAIACGSTEIRVGTALFGERGVMP